MDMVSKDTDWPVSIQGDVQQQRMNGRNQSVPALQPTNVNHICPKRIRNPNSRVVRGMRRYIASGSTSTAQRSTPLWRAFSA